MRKEIKKYLDDFVNQVDNLQKVDISKKGKNYKKNCLLYYMEYPSIIATILTRYPPPTLDKYLKEALKIGEEMGYKLGWDNRGHYFDLPAFDQEDFDTLVERARECALGLGMHWWKKWCRLKK